MQESLIKRIRVEASETGLTETRTKVDALAKSESDLGKAQRDRAAIEAMKARQVQQFNQIAQLQLVIQQQATMQAAQMAVANDNLVRSHSHVADVLRVATKTAIDHAASWAATAGAVGAGVLVFGSLLAILGPIVLAYKLLKDAIGLVTDAWTLGSEKLAEYVDLAKKAAAADLATSFFQKISKAATDAKLPVEDLTAAMKSLAAVSTEKLGGSDLQNRLDASVKAGNFAGNTGVDALASANTTEDKFRAIVSLIDQAMRKGERLAALDIASKAFGPAVTSNLMKDAEYLTRMVASADKIAATELVSDQDIGRALDLQNRYDAAVKILETRWHPLQGLLTAAGLAMHETWVNIVSSIASAVDWATRLIGKLSEAPGWFQQKLNAGATAFMVATTTPESRKAAEQSLGISSDPADIAATVATNARTEAVSRLTAGLQNQKAVEQAVAQVNAIQNSVWKDTSRSIDDAAKKVNDVRDQWDRAQDAIEKHTAKLQADTQAVGLGVGALEEFRARAQLLTAAQQAGIPVTDEVRARIDALSKAAGNAATELAKAQVASQIDFTRKTMFVSPEQVQIASQLRGIYGNDIPKAMASAEAAAIRMQNAQSLVVTGFRDIGESVLTAALTGKNAMAALMSGLDALSAKMAKAGFNNAVDGLLSGNLLQAGMGAAELAGSAIISAFTGDQKKQEQLRKARAEWEVTAPDFGSFLAPAAKPIAMPSNDNEKEPGNVRVQRRRIA